LLVIGARLQTLASRSDVAMTDYSLRFSQSEDSTDSSDLITRAKNMIPLLRANAGRSERIGRLTDESADALREAGFLTLFSPRKFGGHECDLRTAAGVFAALAGGCGSSAWVAMLMSGGSYLVSLLGEQARYDVWGGNPQAAICGGTAMTGSARRVPGGLRVSGRWQPLTGVDHAQWVMVGALVSDENGTVVDQGMALIPLGEVQVIQTWHVAGMQGTGSNTVTVDDVFVPGHRVLSFPKALIGGYADEHPSEPLYGAPLSSFLALTLMGPILGMAESALHHTMELLDRGKSISGSIYRDARDSPSTQFHVADATSLIDSARLHTHRAIEDVEHALETRSQLALERRARIRMDIGTAVKSSREAVNLIFSIGGSSGFALSNPVQRIWRDLEAAARHQLLSHDLSREIYARSLLGIEEQVSLFI
jgi:3-hydroxy-9,10-secoandrosta-1,3,5(10)-triene-9,17-dione monooxygenase